MITYVKGDITESGADVIVNLVNCEGKVDELSHAVFSKYPQAKKWYADICSNPTVNPSRVRPSPLLGKITYDYIPDFRVGEDTEDMVLIANCFIKETADDHINAKALGSCFSQLKQSVGKSSIAVPAAAVWAAEKILKDCNVAIYSKRRNALYDTI